MTKSTLFCSALLVALASSSAVKAETPWNVGFKLGFGVATGDLHTVRDNNLVISGRAELSYDLRPGSAIVVEGGFSYLPAAEVVVSQYYTQKVNVPVTDPRYVKYLGNSTYETRVRKTNAEGFLAGAMFRQSITESLYGQAGIRLNILKSRENDYGTRLTTGTAPASPSAATPIVAIETIDSVNEKTKCKAAFTAGVGYKFFKDYSIEANISQASIESYAKGAQSGLVVEVAYRMKF